MLSSSAFEEVWQRMLMEIVLLRDHVLFYSIQTIGAAPRHPFVDLLGPRVMYVKMTALLDEALIQFVEEHNIRVAPAFREDLNGRISCLASHGLLANADDLHRLRRRRNELAHEHSASTTWDEIASDVGQAHMQLRHLGIVGELPRFESFVERNVDLAARPGISMIHRYVVGVKDSNDRVRAEYKWAITYYRAGWDEKSVKEGLERGDPVPDDPED